MLFYSQKVVVVDVVTTERTMVAGLRVYQVSLIVVGGGVENKHFKFFFVIQNNIFLSMI